MVDSERGAFAAWVLDPVGEPRGTTVLIPGFTGSKEDFVAVLAPLADLGWRVVAYDQRGQHETPGSDGAYSLEEFAADAAAVARAGAVGPVHLVGHSFGGLVAQQLVLDEPDLLATLTLLCSGPGALPGEEAPPLLLLAEALGAFPIEQVWEAKLAWEIQHGWVPPSDPAILTFLRRRFVRNDPASLAAMAALLVGAPDRVDHVAELAPPTLVVHGESDDGWPTEVQQEMAVRLGARFDVVRGAAHSPAAEAPLATATLLSAFWSERVPV